jgi:hypothetical protein
MPAVTDWYRGENSHGEWTTQQPTNPSDPNDAINNPVVENAQYSGKLIGTRLVLGFAIAGLQYLPASWDAPYSQGQCGDPAKPNYIVAENYDALAWYCWSPASGREPDGGFYIPTYDFNDLWPAEQQTRTITFHTSDDHGIKPTDPRYGMIEWSKNCSAPSGDIFLNRTTDLKNGEWLSNMAKDLGDAYPWDPLRGGNVAVFHNTLPEPAGLLALANGLIGLVAFAVRRRR